MFMRNYQWLEFYNKLLNINSLCFADTKEIQLEVSFPHLRWVRKILKIKEK